MHSRAQVVAFDACKLLLKGRDITAEGCSLQARLLFQ